VSGAKKAKHWQVKVKGRDNVAKDQIRKPIIAA
jgi:hypothetical protein